MKAILTRTISFILAAVLVIESFNISSVSVQAGDNLIFKIGWGKNYSTEDPVVYTFDKTTNPTLNERWGNTNPRKIDDIQFKGEKSGKSNEYIFDKIL